MKKFLKNIVSGPLLELRIILGNIRESLKKKDYKNAQSYIIELQEILLFALNTKYLDQTEVTDKQVFFFF